MTEIIVSRLKGAEQRDCIPSRKSLRTAIETSDLSLPGLVEVVNKVMWVRPVIVCCLNETEKKESGDGLVIWLSL